MNIWIILLILLGVSLLISSIGYKKFLWFISVGYGLSIFGCGVAIITIFAINKTLNITGLIASILLMIYGIRLGGFLLIRELK
ncbi:MAG: steroid reductase, partial [Clostridia bacterium]|nr:steroid reductase [Clostridia bacterium]